MDKEYLKIIDRANAIKQIEEHFSDEVKLIEDVTNYGCYLMSEILNQENKGIDYLVVISILLKHNLTMLDSIGTQVANANVLSAFLQARSILEVSLNIEWMLKEDTLKRAQYYYIAYYRKEKARILNFVKEKYEQTELAIKIEAARLKTRGIPKDFDKATLRALEAIDSVLGKSEYFEIINDFEQIENRRSGNKILDWYVPTGIQNLREMADKLDAAEKHYIFYKQYSKLMHGASIDEHVIFGDSKVYLKPLRELMGIDILITTALSDIFRCLGLIVEKYLPTKKKEFAEKYIEDWQHVYKNIKQVNYN